jgi:hypothetical protein
MNCMLSVLSRSIQIAVREEDWCRGFVFRIKGATVSDFFPLIPVQLHTAIVDTMLFGYAMISETTIVLDEEKVPQNAHRNRVNHPQLSLLILQAFRIEQCRRRCNREFKILKRLIQIPSQCGLWSFCERVISDR